MAKMKMETKSTECKMFLCVCFVGKGGCCWFVEEWEWKWQSQMVLLLMPFFHFCCLPTQKVLYSCMHLAFTLEHPPSPVFIQQNIAESARAFWPHCCASNVCRPAFFLHCHIFCRVSFISGRLNCLLPTFKVLHPHTHFGVEFAFIPHRTYDNVI